MSNLSIVGDQAAPGEASASGARLGATTRSLITDWLGVAASIGCAIHCAAMPFVVAFLPMLGLRFLAHELFHKAMFGVCTLLALVAFLPGWRRHRKWLPVGVAVFGLSFIGVAAFALEDECCAACAPADSQTESEACTDENCEHCLAESNSSPSTEEQETSSQGLAPFVPWVTPLGGVMLVSAHLLNRRHSCRCGCCPTPADVDES